MGQTGCDGAEEKFLYLPGENIVQLTDQEVRLQKSDQNMCLADSREIDIRGKQVEINAAGKIRMRAKRILLFAESGIKSVVG